MFAVVTGAHGFLGKAIVTALSVEYDSILAVDVNTDSVESFKSAASSCRIESIRCDVSDPDDRCRVFEHIGQDQKLDLLVNCAAVTGRPFVESSVGYSASELQLEAARTLEVNVLGTLFMSLDAIQFLMRATSPKIINFSSIYGHFAPRPDVYQGTSLGTSYAYGASKAAVSQVTRQLAINFGPEVRVNAIAMGGVQGGQSPKFVDQYIKHVPARRMATHLDVTEAVLWLASDASSYVTGQTFFVDGGWSSW